MERSIKMNYENIYAEKTLNSQIPKLDGMAQYLYSIIGFVMGGIVVLIGVTIEDFIHNISITYALSEISHYIFPFIMGITSGIFGFFYGMKSNQKNSTLNALFHSQQMLSLITDNISARITYIDTDLRFRFVNKTVENAYMISKKDIYGKKVIDIIGEDVFNMAKKYFEMAFSGETVNYETSRTNKDGQIAYFRSILVPHYDGEEKIIGFFNLVTDITDIRMREEKIKKHEEELVKLNATKDKLFSIIAHDLRSPFNAMLGFSEILTKGIETLSREKIKYYNDIISHALKGQFRLLENLLNWSRLQTGRMKFIQLEVKLNKVIIEIINVLSVNAASKHIQIFHEIAQDVVIYADEYMLHSILRNLISNAIKFTGTDGEISISSSTIDGYEQITVSDNGIGLKSEDIDKIFKIDSNYTTLGTDGEKGTGLGLVLIKEMIEKHQGRIWVESEVGKRTDFKFTMPIKKMEAV